MQWHFPESEQSALNAGHQLNSSWKHKGLSFIGGWEVTENEIRISARGLLELLSGQITQERFLKLHSWAPMANPFQTRLDQGRLITAIAIEKRGDQVRDDDWAVIRFGHSDPAVAPFKVPPS
jgi:hypothetical protein